MSARISRAEPSAIAPLVARVRRAPALSTGLAVMVIAALALTLAHQAPRAPLPPGSAIRDAVKDPAVRQTLAGTHWDRVTASPVDGRVERVSFYERDRIVGQVAIDGAGRAVQPVNFARHAVPYGNWIAYQPAVLIALATVFVLMTGVAPWRRMRNVDVLAALSLLAPVLLLQQHYVDASVLTAAPGLVYLMLRCCWMGLGPVRPAPPSAPLLSALTRNLDPSRRARILRLLLIALGCVFLMVGVSSPDAVDVAYAVMEGATKLVHGVLPYGHMPGDVVHGDTYPLLSYALYAPLAWVAPVRSTWDSVDVALAAAVAAALATAWALLRAGGLRLSPARAPEAEEAGLRAALAWLSFPPLLITVSTGTTDVALAAMLALAVLMWRRPAIAAGALAGAGWFKLAPALLLPIWLSPLRGRRLAAAVGAVAAISVPLLLLLVVLGGSGGPAAMLRALSFQFSRGSPQSLWSALGLEGLQPVAAAGVFGLIAAATVRLRREPKLGEDRARIAALAAAVLIAVQLSADYWAFLYLVWIVPLLCLSAFESVEPAARRAPSPAGVQTVLRAPLTA